MLHVTLPMTREMREKAIFNCFRALYLDNSPSKVRRCDMGTRFALLYAGIGSGFIHYRYCAL